MVNVPELLNMIKNGQLGKDVRLAIHDAMEKVNDDTELLKNNFTRSATIKIAASNATDKSKAAADYVCTGENDEVIINAAIAELDGIGGCVELSEGTFYLGESGWGVQLDGIWLRGQGQSTVLTSENPGMASEYGCEIADGKISDLSITGCMIGIHIQGTATIEGCFIYDNIMEGIWVSTTSEDSIIVNNRLDSNDGGDIVDEGANTIISNNIGSVA